MVVSGKFRSIMCIGVHKLVLCRKTMFIAKESCKFNHLCIKKQQQCKYIINGHVVSVIHHLRADCCFRFCRFTPSLLLHFFLYLHFLSLYLHFLYLYLHFLYLYLHFLYLYLHFLYLYLHFLYLYLRFLYLYLHFL